MRVGVGIAVTGKVLQRRQHPVVLKPADIAAHQAGNRVGILAERACIDDGVQRVVVDVSVGRKIHVDAHGPALERRDATDRIGVALVSCCAGGHDIRECGGADDAHGRAPFEIGGDEQG